MPTARSIRPLLVLLACLVAAPGVWAQEPVGSPGPDGPTRLGPEHKPIADLNVNVSLPEGRLPRDYAGERLAMHGPPAGQVLIRTAPIMEYHWKAPGSRHNPLYFEEVNAERYGYACFGDCCQPVVSAAHFFGTIPALPYLMAADCPRECVYTLGHYRPGNCNPWRMHFWPCRVDAAVVEAAAVVGVAALIP